MVAVIGTLLVRRKEATKQPDVEVIAKWSDDGETLMFPLAEVEWSIGEVSQMAVRDVVLMRPHYSAFSTPLDIAAASGFGECSRMWTCVYVFGKNGPGLVFAQPWDFGNTGFEKALRTFCEAIGKPLKEPDPKRHAASVISI